MEKDNQKDLHLYTEYCSCMSKGIIGNRIETKVNTSIAIPRSVAGYGKAILIEGRQARNAIWRKSFKEFIRYSYGEYVTGILFLFAVSLYTLLMPVGITNPLKYVVVMIDRFMKKVLDIGGAVLGLILALPFFIVVPILIKLTSRGPVFYTQDRIGVNRRRRGRRLYKTEVCNSRRIRERRREDYMGRPFKVMKFRTMVHNAEKQSGPVWAIKNDTRITGLGRILRKTRIDEIPQLINVLKGEMSLVGPRPERPVFVKDLSARIPNYRARLNVRPGITGLAQVNRGYDSSLDSVVKKVEHDIKYIRNWSISSDLKILMKTIVVVITGRGAF